MLSSELNFKEKTINLLNLYNKKKYYEVVESANELIKNNPKSFVLWNLLGAALKSLGNIEESIIAFKKVTELNPEYADGHNNLGVIFQEQGNLDDSIKCFKRAIFLNSDYAQAYNNIGIAYRQMGRLKKAHQYIKKAISSNPNYAEAYNNLATTLKEQGKINEAVEFFNKAISLKPNYAEAYYNMGKIQKEKNKFEESIKFYNKALSLKSDYAEAYYNIGIISQEQGKLEEAIDYFNKALLIKPNYEKAQAQKLYQKAKICDWGEFIEDREAANKLGKLNNDIPPFTMLSFEDEPDNHLLRSQIYAKKNFYQKQIPLKKNTQFFKNKRLHIGYFSADFQNHATMYLMTDIFEKYNKENFKVYVYSFGKSLDSDVVREKLKNSVDVFRDVIDLDEKNIALLSREDKIDIAIDLKGYTRDSRTKIFAYRAAPIQINFLGYPGTIGADFMDYIIADTVIIPDNKRNSYSEKKIYLPFTYQPNSYSASAVKKNFTKSEMELPEKSFVFCCFNNSYKISLNEFNIWMRLLKRVEGSVLWLMGSNKWAENNLCKEAEKYGIKRNRLIFANKLPYPDHLARCKLGDLFLDTFNVNAHTTASDVLCAGMPLITKIGEGFAARVASSILNAVDLHELITKSEEEYEALILEIATSPEKLIKIKKKLSENILTKPLFNSEMFIKYLEDGYNQVYQNYLDGNKPKTIFINK